MMDPADPHAVLDIISRSSYDYDTQDWDLVASFWVDDQPQLVRTRSCRN